MPNSPITPTISPRAELARELHKSDLIGSFSDYSRVADRIQQRLPRAEILEMPELKRWDKALAWLQERLTDEGAVS